MKISIFALFIFKRISNIYLCERKGKSVNANFLLQHESKTSLALIKMREIKIKGNLLKNLIECVLSKMRKVLMEISLCVYCLLLFHGLMNSEELKRDEKCVINELVCSFSESVEELKERPGFSK